MTELPPSFQLSRLIMSLWVPQAIHAAARLGVADAMSGPTYSADVAHATGADPTAVERLLRALVVAGVCAEEGGRYALTPIGACLRADAPDSLRHWALLMGGRTVWEQWGHLSDCVRTGKTAWQLTGGADPFTALAADPDGAAIFHGAMVEMTRRIARGVVASYDFSSVTRAVDVGGGYGALLAGILAAYPHLRGSVLDLPSCRAGADRLLADAGLSDRADFLAGDFFESIPAGADIYLLKSVLHDWNDERGLAILHTCRAAMAEASRLLVIEPPRAERLTGTPIDHVLAASDLNMLVVAGGCERSEDEYRALLEAAGLRVLRVIATPSAMRIFEATRA